LITFKIMADPVNYTIGWICAISTEYVAAQAFLDKKHGNPDRLSPGDCNNYTLGTIAGHNVVIAVLPNGEYGTASAAVVATHMLRSFPNVRVGLMVGIGGGVPSARHDIRLGDIVVSSPFDGQGGVVQYDFGKAIQGQSFQLTRFLNQPPMILQTAVSGLSSQYQIEGHSLHEAVCEVLEQKPRLRGKYRRPDLSTDRLYLSNVIHPSSNIETAECAVMCGDKPPMLISRKIRTEDEDNPMIHYGLIASSNQLMKNALTRDKLAAEKDVLCFEMEAAGLMNHFPCLVVRGICDYSDSHKNKEWQGYAAMAAAAYAKDLLCQIIPSQVEAERKIIHIMAGELYLACFQMSIIDLVLS
jgi:nucleoside phosphorylase